MGRRICLGFLFVGNLVVWLVPPHALLLFKTTPQGMVARPSVQAAQLPALPPILKSSLLEARAHLDGGRFREALRIYDKAVEAARDHPQARLAALSTQGLAFKRLGDFHQALSLYHQALELAQGLDDQQSVGNILHNIGACYTSLGELQLAKDMLGEALQNRLSPWGKSITRTAIATVYDLEGNHEKAVEELRQALILLWGIWDLAPETWRSDRATTLDRLGTAAWNAGRPQVARRAYASGRTLLHGDQRVTNLAIIDSNLGRLELELGFPERALALLQPARSILSQHGFRHAEAVNLLGIAQAQQQRGALESAQQALQQALDLVEGLRSPRLNSYLRSVFLASHHTFYEVAIQLNLAQYAKTSEERFLHRSLELAERAKARSLLDLLKDGPRFPRRLDGAAPRDRQVQARTRPLEVELNRLEHQRLAHVQKGAPLTQIAKLEKAQRMLILENEEAWNTIQVGSESDRMPLPDLPRMQALLDSNTRFLVYSLGETASNLWFVGPNEIKSWPLPARTKIETLAKKSYLSFSLSDQPGGSDTDPIDLLSALLLPFELDPLEHLRLVVVPDGVLHSIPFAALTNPRTGRLLVVDHELINLPSIAVLEVLRWREQNRARAPRLIAVMADPVYGLDDRRFGSPPQGRSLPQTTLRGDQPNLPRLYYSSREAEAILSLVPQSRRLGLLGFDARRQAILEGRLSTFQIVHLSVHGQLVYDRPELSSLVFSQVDQKGRPLDGRLFMHEIDDLNLPCELVVLSACNSARGRMIRGEGLVGLTRAVFLAGANRALVSLWFVHDEATAELMVQFYKALLHLGQPPAQALQTAQLGMLASEQWSAPYYWAGFVLQGDWRWHLDRPLVP